MYKLAFFPYFIFIPVIFIIYFYFPQIEIKIFVSLLMKIALVVALFLSSNILVNTVIFPHRRKNNKLVEEFKAEAYFRLFVWMWLCLHIFFLEKVLLTPVHGLETFYFALGCLTFLDILFGLNILQEKKFSPLTTSEVRLKLGFISIGLIVQSLFIILLYIDEVDLRLLKALQAYLILVAVFQIVKVFKNRVGGNTVSKED